LYMNWSALRGGGGRDLNHPSKGTIGRTAKFPKTLSSSRKPRGGESRGCSETQSRQKAQANGGTGGKVQREISTPSRETKERNLRRERQHTTEKEPPQVEKITSANRGPDLWGETLLGGRSLREYIRQARKNQTASRGIEDLRS